MRKYASDMERITARIERVGDCWEWTGRLCPKGYARFNMAGRTIWAHRFSYELYVGPIPAGLHIDHLCRNRRCVNPAHLEPVTCAVNLRRSPLTIQGKNAAKTHCLRGHPFDEANTLLRDGKRACRTCRAARARASRAAARSSD